MPAVSLAPSVGVLWQGFTTGGLPLNAGLMYTYIAGGTTPQATYTTSAGTVQNANPIVLGADGRPPNEIWFVQGTTYRIDLYDSLSNLIASYDNITGINDLGTALATGFNWVVATGTANAITATYSPAVTSLIDGLLCWFRATGANTSTTPTFAPNGLTARTITKLGGAALSAGDITANFAEYVLRYNLANTRWELLNPSIPSSYVLAKSWVAVSCPADTTEDTLATITVPANALGANGRLRIRTWWIMTSSGNNKTTRIRFSGGAGTAYATNVFTTITSLMYEADIQNVNATNSQKGNSFGIAIGPLTVAPLAATGTSAADTTAATTIVITGQKATAGETLTLDSYLVELMP